MGQAPCPALRSAQPFVYHLVSMIALEDGISCLDSVKGRLTAEVLIVIVGARARRGGWDGDGDVRPFLTTSVMIRSAV